MLNVTAESFSCFTLTHLQAYCFLQYKNIPIVLFIYCQKALEEKTVCSKHSTFSKTQQHSLNIGYLKYPTTTCGEIVSVHLSGIGTLVLDLW